MQILFFPDNSQFDSTLIKSQETVLKFKWNGYTQTNKKKDLADGKKGKSPPYTIKHSFSSWSKFNKFNFQTFYSKYLKIFSTVGRTEINYHFIFFTIFVLINLMGNLIKNS